MKYIPKDKGIIHIILIIMFWFSGITLWNLAGWSKTFTNLYNVSLTKTSIELWQIVSYLDSPSIEFLYEWNKYIVTSNNMWKCRHGNPCNKIGDKKYILVNQEMLSNSFVLTDIVWMILAMFLPPIAIITGIYTYVKSRKRKEAIEKMQSMQSYTVWVIIEMKTFTWKGGWYDYVCKDNQTGVLYTSDRIHENNFIIGSPIHIYHNDSYPGISWVDFNGVPQEVENTEIS